MIDLKLTYNYNQYWRATINNLILSRKHFSIETPKSQSKSLTQPIRRKRIRNSFGEFYFWQSTIFNPFPLPQTMKIPLIRLNNMPGNAREW